MARPIKATPQVCGESAKRIFERLLLKPALGKEEIERRGERIRTSLQRFRELSPRKVP